MRLLFFIHRLLFCLLQAGNISHGQWAAGGQWSWVAGLLWLPCKSTSKLVVRRAGWQACVGPVNHRLSRCSENVNTDKHIPGSTFSPESWVVVQSVAEERGPYLGCFTPEKPHCLWDTGLASHGVQHWPCPALMANMMLWAYSTMPCLAQQSCQTAALLITLIEGLNN